jgi:HEAT repeat protein
VRYLLVFLLIACGSAPRGRVAAAVDRGDFDEAFAAYEEFAAHEGTDNDLLGRVAGLLLEREARSEDAELRRAAFTQLSLAGTAGMPILRELANDPGVTPARLAALQALAQRGDQASLLVLRSFADHDDPEVVAASIAGMDPELDRALLLRLAQSDDAVIRREAVTRLARAVSDPAVLAELERIARVDAEALVRAAAVRSLGQADEGAIAILRERLSDPEAIVRFAAIGALMDADQEQARIAFGALLEIAPSAAGVEAARLLALLEDDESALPGPAAARAYLLRALASDDPSLRAQAGIALSSLPVDRGPPLDALRTALEREVDPDVRVAFARALYRHDRPAAELALRELLESEGMPRVQAALLLAERGDRPARDVLEEIAGSDAASMLRRTAVRALARDALAPDLALPYLRDADAIVRIYAAGGILAAAART